MKQTQYCFWCDLFAALLLTIGAISLTYVVVCISHEVYPKAFWYAVGTSVCGLAIGGLMVFKDT